MSSEIIFCGSGTENQNGYISAAIELEKIGKVIVGKDGKKYLELPQNDAIFEKKDGTHLLKIGVGRKRTVGKYNETHYLTLHDKPPVPKNQPKESTPPKIEDEPPF